MHTILAVDDEEANLSMVEYALQEEYEVIPVRSGATAMKCLKRKIPDLILLDIRMPEMDGFEVCRQIREHEEWRNIPVIFLTSANDVDTEDQCFEMGAVDFISKPFEPKIVRRRVRRTLELIQYRQLKTGNPARVYTHLEDNEMQEQKQLKPLQVTAEGMTLGIMQEDIYYIEVYNNTCIIRTANREIETRATLECLQRELDKRFIRTGRSYVVNTDYIAEIADDILIMKTGKQIKIPRRSKKEIVKEIVRTASAIVKI